MDGIENYTWLVLLGVGILILVGIPHAVSGWAWVFRKNNERVFADKQIMTAVINACHHKYPSWLDRSIEKVVETWLNNGFETPHNQQHKYAVNLYDTLGARAKTGAAPK